MLAFEDNCFCFQVTDFFYQKRELLFKMFINNALYFTKTYNWKTKAVIFKSLCNSLDIIILMLLAKFKFDGWFHFFKKQGIIKKNRISPKT